MSLYNVSSQLAWVKAVCVIVNAKRIRVYKRSLTIASIYVSLFLTEYSLKPLHVLTSGAERMFDEERKECSDGVRQERLLPVPLRQP